MPLGEDSYNYSGNKGRKTPFLLSHSTGISQGSVELQKWPTTLRISYLPFLLGPLRHACNFRRVHPNNQQTRKSCPPSRLYAGGPTPFIQPSCRSSDRNLTVKIPPHQKSNLNPTFQSINATMSRQKPSRRLCLGTRTLAHSCRKLPPKSLTITFMLVTCKKGHPS
ncbi:hypothetical protein NC653_029563 [Populus alba x Populus x berolinensis]|uniref:Uncharacterized protein n=1 Tax=Populus alba x Populus x berolinensis TaxID=444605 RepID=A0AAD6Q4M0_9ROSI|nr:hypothetical protein NC653_029563 [Populus alba x Populus x berolinensis]